MSEIMTFDDWVNLDDPHKLYEGFRVSKRDQTIYWYVSPMARSNTYCIHAVGERGGLTKRRYGFRSNRIIYPVPLKT